jgi:hypothetical protein
MSVAASRIRVGRPPTVRLLDVGPVGTVSERSHAYRVQQPPSLVNQYAAMPSFHAGWDLLMGIALVREGRTLLTRVVGCVLPVAMALAVVVTANHDILDVVAGTWIVAVSLVVAARITRSSPRLRLCTADGEKHRALSRWGGHPQRSTLDTSPVIHEGDPDVVELHAIRDHQADVSAAAQRPPDNVSA